MPRTVGTGTNGEVSAAVRDVGIALATRSVSDMPHPMNGATVSHPDHLWNVILAAGDGTRLASLTTSLYGHPLPKQFAVIVGARSLLQETVERQLAVAPSERTVVVVAEACADLAREQLSGFPGIHIVAQPRNRGTGPGVLLPLAYVIRRDPDARVVIAPSDHHFSRPVTFLRVVADAADRGTSLILVAVPADRAEREYGWIEPGAAFDGPVRHIRRFVEKPGLAEATELLRRGALWNTFVIVAHAVSLWRTAERHLPVQAALIESCMDLSAGTNGQLRSAYEVMDDANFSRAVLEHERGIGVVCAEACGFSDWGSPQRVFESLRGTQEGAVLEQRLTNHPMKSMVYVGHPPSSGGPM